MNVPWNRAKKSYLRSTSCSVDLGNNRIKTDLEQNKLVQENTASVVADDDEDKNNQRADIEAFRPGLEDIALKGEGSPSWRIICIWAVPGQQNVRSYSGSHAERPERGWRMKSGLAVETSRTPWSYG